MGGSSSSPVWNMAPARTSATGLRRSPTGLGGLNPLVGHRHRTPGEAAAAVHVKTPTIVKMAARMAAAGLLVRRRDGHDSRLVRLWLTNKGRSLQDPIEANRTSLERLVTANLTDAER